MPHPGLLHPEPLRQATADLYLRWRHSNPVLSQSLGLWVLLCTRFVWILWASLVGMGFDPKCDFTPPTNLLRLLLCSWTWCISSKSLQRNAAAAPVPTFLLGLFCPWTWAVSSQSSSTMQPQLQRAQPLKLVHTWTQEKGAVIPQETDPKLPVSVQESPERRGSAVASCRAGALSVPVWAWDLWKEVAIIFIISTIVWPQENNREGTQHHPSTENWIKDLLRMAPPIRAKPSFPFSQYLPSGSFHKPLSLLHQMADRLKTTNTEN